MNIEIGKTYYTNDRPKGKVKVLGKQYLKTEEGQRVADRDRMSVEILDGVCAGMVIAIRKEHLIKEAKEKNGNE